MSENSYDNLFTFINKEKGKKFQQPSLVLFHSGEFRDDCLAV
jgi:hypothetical protein